MRLAVLTSGRQDWGILRSTCWLVRGDRRFDLRLIVGGMHCRPEFGHTERLIAEDGFEAAERLDWIDGTGGPAEEAGRAVGLVGAALARHEPAALVLVGDRYETAAAAIAATVAGIPIVHLHGGEETGGAFDDGLRHAITKLSHLHLVSHAEHARRIEALGEDPATIHVVGAPGLDNLRRDDLPDRAELESGLGIQLEPPVVVVTLHPTTLGLGGDGGSGDEVGAVVQAMDRVAATYVITLPNSDPGNGPIRLALTAAGARPGRVTVEALGERRYWGLLRIADTMLGNSSSALIEAPAVGLPAVNVGDRQLGRLRGDNVIDVASHPDAIEAALRAALDPATRNRLAASASPFGDGLAAERIVAILAGWAVPHPPRKAPVRVNPAVRPGVDRLDGLAGLVLIGGGEHARVVYDAALRQGCWSVDGYVDPRRSPELDRMGVSWLGDDDEAGPAVRGRRCVLAIGEARDPSVREAIIARYADSSVTWAAVVHPAAVVAPDAWLGPGAVVLARAIVNAGARLGEHTIVNSGSIVEHDVDIGAFSHVGPGAMIGGAARIGRRTTIGIGARVRDHVAVGDDAIVGMGAVVVDNVAPASTVMGVPARAVQRGAPRAVAPSGSRR